MKRHKPEGLTIATNVMDILTEINNHVMFADAVKPNQTHEKFITYDISCNEDFALHARYYDWKSIFEFFRKHDRAMASLATKYVNKRFLEFNPEGKVRIRFSLMPESYSNVLEPKTSPIIDRIKAIDTFINAGYDAHINFSPVIVTAGWLEKYRELFTLVHQNVLNKDKVRAEVIFLTHNEQKHKHNLALGLQGEHLLWRPELQEPKVSEYGGNNIRYKSNLKSQYIKQWTDLHDEIIPWNTIRYIF